MKVTRQNYKQYKYHYEGSLENLTDEELAAQKFHLTDIYKGAKSPLKQLKKIKLQRIFFEKQRRMLAKIHKDKEKGK